MLNISNIQHFSVGDGEGIRTTVFFKGCNLCCPWCHNPENLKAEPDKLYYENLDKTEIMGRCVLPEEIMPELLEDKEFYEESLGGVTFSGGEVMLQAKNAAELAKLLKENDISVLIDTAGNVPYENFKALNPYVSGYLFDFKTADEEKYKSIGANLHLITENITRLINENVNVYIRIPLIPGFNTDEKSIEEMCTSLRKMGVENVHLLPFHRLGSSKYKAMGIKYLYADTLPLTDEEINRIRNQYSEYFTVTM